jgi:hypothetical protein
MTRFIHALAATVAAAILLPPATPVRAAPVPEGSRFALVIGNSAYAGVPALPACTASAHVVTAVLKRAGFLVTEQMDRTIGQMDADLAALARAVNDHPGSSAVAYICGYAVGFNNRTFLLPVSASIQRDTDVLTQGVVAKSVPDAIRRSNAVGGLVLFDAVAWPNSPSKLALDTLMTAPPEGKVGVAADSTAIVPPEGATPLAAALGAAMTGPDIEAGAVLTSLKQRLSGSGTMQLAMRPPAETAWLAGGPAPPPPVPPPAPPTAPPPPAAAPMPAAPTPAAAAPAAPPAPQFPDEDHMTAADRERVQTALQHVGYYDGKVDGIFGPDTRAAIRRYQHEIGADMTGQITPKQAARLVGQMH